MARYRVTVTYEFEHSAGQLVPKLEEVAAVTKKGIPKGEELHVHVVRGRQFEGCRVRLLDSEIIRTEALA